MTGIMRAATAENASARPRVVAAVWAFLRVVSFVSALALTIQLVFVSLGAISELSNRLAAHAFLEQKLHSLTDKLARLSVPTSGYSGSAGPTTSQSLLPRSTSGAEFNEGTARIAKLRGDISVYETLIDKISSLDFTGARDEKETVSSIKSIFSDTQAVDNELSKLNSAQIDKDKKNMEINSIIGSIGQLNVVLQNLQDLKQTISSELSNDAPNRSVEEYKFNINYFINNLKRNELISSQEADEINGIMSVEGSSVSSPLALYRRALGILRATVSRALADIEFRIDVTNKDKDLAISESQSIDDKIKSINSEIQRINSANSASKTSEDFPIPGIGVIIDIGNSFSLWVARRHTDYLIGLAMICCGGLGAGVAGLRRSTAPTFRPNYGALRSRNPFIELSDLALGFAAGFITFLIFKGGKFLFVAQLGGVAVPLNPYAAGFSAILAGLFTETAYRVLATLVEQLANKFETNSEATRPAPSRRDHIDADEFEKGAATRRTHDTDVAATVDGESVEHADAVGDRRPSARTDNEDDREASSKDEVDPEDQSVPHGEDQPLKLESATPTSTSAVVSRLAEDKERAAGD